MGYQDFFNQVTGFAPYPWQENLSNWNGETIAVVAAPTGAGKESGAVTPWLYAHSQGKPVPTRLVYALPTRSLVDQVYANIQKVVEKSGLEDIKVYCLKGGQVEHGFEQDLTQPAILVGTQDQLLSRALNRGFGVSWGQRPIHCAALTNDCRWILDEIQLTGVAYSTLAQLYKHWRTLGTYGPMQLCLMSATFDDAPLRKENLAFDRFELSDADFDNKTLSAKIKRPKPVFQTSVETIEDVADLSKAKHVPGTLSLVVVNTVARAREIGELLKDLDPLVIHSRFLGIDREERQKRLYGYQGLIISTQVVEAGVDLDAELLITELCPWSSFVQRCGRCGRKRTDNPVEIHWLDYREGWKPVPYSKEECQDTRDRLLKLADANLDALSHIPLPDLKLDGPPLLQSDVETFFCTHYKKRDARLSATAPKYVRDVKSFTVSVLWSTEPPKRLPHQRYVCPVPTEELKKFCQSHNVNYRVWGEDDWEPKLIENGDVVWLPLAAGGYSHQVGWTGNPDDKPKDSPIQIEPKYNDPHYKINLALGTHLKDTEDAFRGLIPHFKGFIPHLQKLGLPESLIAELCRCARWHDWGKAHPTWQAYANAEHFQEKYLAKSTDYQHWSALKGFRHELASAFAAADQGAPFLAQYLIAAHHGKVRDSLLPPHPSERLNPQVLRGVELGTSLPLVEIADEGMVIETLPEVTLAFPDKPDRWSRRVKELLREYGPYRLIYLEALIRNADIQASKFRDENYLNEEGANDNNCNG
ncbi:CRISPR-associated helicase Cas3' [Halomicronema sp. CCY15110]|uniref:CRISPR-associated helicase Cas3' n=1 Tax=Halomicronema sp. CCY15110 TaxID=2767773 RepID=UPI001EF370AB|nr:CRISPR-associated helicase Cas3' [Halomicronema sp. CCY15110]